jgi:uncharacterized membrane protein
MYNLIGLALDMLGVVLLFFYQMPKAEHGWQLESAPSEDEQSQSEAKNRRIAIVGLTLILLGFALQFYSALSVYSAGTR